MSGLEPTSARNQCSPGVDDEEILTTKAPGDVSGRVIPGAFLVMAFDLPWLSFMLAAAQNCSDVADENCTLNDFVAARC